MEDKGILPATRCSYLKIIGSLQDHQVMKLIYHIQALDQTVKRLASVFLSGFLSTVCPGLS